MQVIQVSNEETIELDLETLLLMVPLVHLTCLFAFWQLRSALSSQTSYLFALMPGLLIPQFRFYVRAFWDYPRLHKEPAPYLMLNNLVLLFLSGLLAVTILVSEWIF